MAPMGRRAAGCLRPLLPWPRRPSRVRLSREAFFFVGMFVSLSIDCAVLLRTVPPRPENLVDDSFKSRTNISRGQTPITEEV